MKEKKIIQLGDVRIPAAHIKNYGISVLNIPYEKIYQEASLLWKGDYIPIDPIRCQDLDSSVLTYKRCRNAVGDIYDSETETDKKEPYFTKKTDCLFLSTYEDESFIFPKPLVDFNIEEKLKEINAVFCDI